MSKYVYFYRAVYAAGGTQSAKHGVVTLSEPIDSMERYLNFCDAIATIFAKEDKKNESHTKNVDILALNLLHEINE